MIAGSFLFDCSARATYQQQAEWRWQVRRDALMRLFPAADDA
jgi:hypothetical protein